jgi:hypothetical protein
MRRTGGAAYGAEQWTLSTDKPSYPRLVQLVRSIMNRLSCNQCSLRMLDGNDANPVDPK